MKQYFEKQPYEIDGVIQLKFFMVETDMGLDPEGGRRVRLDVKTVRADKVDELAETYLFVRQSAKSMPVLRLK